MELIETASEHVPAAAIHENNQNCFGFIAFLLTFASAAAILVSIAASQILMGVALMVSLLSGQRLRVPAIARPLALFLIMTVAADLLSGDPRAGWPQIRKFYVFAILILVYTFFRSTSRIAALIGAWGSLAVLSALVGLRQFHARIAEAHRLHWNIYEYVLDQRMTGFASHWMTFGGQQMIVFLMLASFVLFSIRSRWKLPALAALLLIAVTLLLGMTRSVYLGGAPAGLIWLLWRRRKIAVCALPFLGIVIFLFAPAHVRERILSVARPHGEIDSNGRRIIMARAGWAMIRSHPWFGIGPEQPGKQFDHYVPADVPRPLPKGWYGHLHSIYLQYAAERGIPALFFLLWAIGQAILGYLRAVRSAEDSRRWMLNGTIAVIIGILVEGFFEHNLGDSEVLTMFLTVIACACAIADISESGGIRGLDLCAWH